MSTIYYNPENADSILAAAFIKQHEEQWKNKIAVKAYNRITGIQDKIDSSDQTIYVIGCEMLLSDFANLQNSVNKLVVFSYSSGHTLELTENTLQFKPDMKDGVKITAVEEMSEESISKMVLAYVSKFPEYQESYLKACIEPFNDYASFRKMSESNLDFYFTWIQIVQDGLESATKLSDTDLNNCLAMFQIKVPQEQTSPAEKLYLFTKSIIFKNTRRILNRNFHITLFGTQAKSMYLPAVNVNAEYAQDAMRMLKLSYVNFLTYEDTRDFRIWRIVGENKAKTKAIAGLIDHIDSWFDNDVLYLLAHTPSVNK